MSLKILKAGILDTIQDEGRHGYQHLGVNPSGAMDRFAAALANALLGKDPHEAVIELHFPASQFLFEQPAIIALAGADFSATVNGQPVALHHPFAVKKDSVLKFNGIKSGARCYLSFLPSLNIDPWLGSYSTNLKAKAGGWKGRKLSGGDVINFKNTVNIEKFLNSHTTATLPVSAEGLSYTGNEINCIRGSEWNLLSEEARENFSSSWFVIRNDSDRMGYRLEGKQLALVKKEQVISSVAGFGTIQLLPSGQLIVLMADHQTTGGYPKIANVTSAHLPLLAQRSIGSTFRFKLVDIDQAERSYISQRNYLAQVRNAMQYRLKEILS
jgi:antagonist of KipI